RDSPQRLIDELAALFLLVRIAYVFTYLGNRPTLRSILWSLGFFINVAIFFMPVLKRFLPF
ncbi:MAG: MAPEG family protein, partial [Bradyrhizobium guangdongense]